jgi:hypothetical protein
MEKRNAVKSAEIKTQQDAMNNVQDLPKWRESKIDHFGSGNALYNSGVNQLWYQTI